MTGRMVRIGTRGSKLALAQASLVRDDIRAMGLSAELVVIETTGDRVQDRPLQGLGGDGVFLCSLCGLIVGASDRGLTCTSLSLGSIIGQLRLSTANVLQSLAASLHVCADP